MHDNMFYKKKSEEQLGAICNEVKGGEVGIQVFSCWFISAATIYTP